LFRIEPASEPTRDELKGILKHFNKSGVIDKEERKLAELALKMNQKTLAALTTEKGPMVWLSSESTVEEVQPLICQQTYKRYLVVENNEVVGIVLYRHITSCLVSGKPHKKVGDLARQVIFLDQANTLLEAVRAFGAARASVALLSGQKPEQTRMVTAKQVYHAILQAS
jgi:CBS domain containing-hemolysin-like protein